MVGPLSTLDTAGSGAADIAQLFWWMAAVGAALWLALTILALYCSRGPRPANPERFAPWLIVGGGVILPVVLLAALLAVGLPPSSRLNPTQEDGLLTIDVSGEQWWWRVTYTGSSGQPIELANEIRLPVGARTNVRLGSDNVIHSFWIPSISGKVDMIPGRTTHLSLEPTRTGRFRGTCAEYCGMSHALMGFSVEVMERDAFEAWLDAQSRPARAIAATSAGGALFLSNGCGACHAIRGTAARGVIGPDLTHLASRISLAAAAMANDSDQLVKWMTSPHGVKPGALMPDFGVLGSDQLHQMAAYLGELR